MRTRTWNLQRQKHDPHKLDYCLQPRSQMLSYSRSGIWDSCSIRFIIAMNSYGFAHVHAASHHATAQQEPMMQTGLSLLMFTDPGHARKLCICPALFFFIVSAACSDTQ
jgi:hypothetical protein